MAEVADLARVIMPDDAEIFGNQFPAYRDDPLAQTLRAVHALGSDIHYAQRYAEFHRDMVYGDRLAYAEAMATISALAERLTEH